MSTTKKTIAFFVVAAFVINGSALVAQSKSEPAFDVVSIKPNTSADFRSTISARGSRFVATNCTLKRLMQYAYMTGVPLMDDQILSGPAWASSDHFDIEAKVSDETVSLTAPQARLMVRSLLKERFGLQLHTEMRDLPVFDLVVSNPGKIKMSEDQTPPQPTSGPASPAGDALPRGVFGVMAGSSGPVMAGTAIPISTLASMLQDQVGRRVIDRTGLTGLFDIRLTFSRPVVTAAPAPGAQEEATPEQGPSLFTSLQEQLGLRLQAAKAPVQVLIIDSVQKPSSN